MTILIVAIAPLALLSAYVTWRYLENRTNGTAGSERLGLGGRRLTSVQQICEEAASRLELSVVYAEPTESGVQPVAGSPWPVRFDILDTIAAGACLRSGEPAGIGSGQHAASDWLFIPLRRNGQVIAVAGVAGPFCRRRLDPDEPGIQSLRRNFERYLAEHPPVAVLAPAATPPRLRAVEKGHADAA